MEYPELASELIALLEADQREFREFAKLYHAAEPVRRVLDAHRARLRINSRKRAKRMQEIVRLISRPTISRVGIEASEAIAVIALHSTEQTMREVLKLFTTCYAEEPDDVYYQVIPALLDRTLILEHRKQKFGSQWMQGEDGFSFLYPIEDFAHVNERRVEYGLEPLRRPRIVALIDPGQPLVNIPATISDQRLPSEKEFQEYTSDFLN
jgi:hypothetical protein